VKNHPPLQHVKDNSRTEAITVLILRTTKNKTETEEKTETEHDPRSEKNCTIQEEQVK
jgi:hypothetical protein